MEKNVPGTKGPRVEPAAGLRWPSGQFSATSTWIAGSFLVLATAFGILAFRNFPAYLVLLTILLPSAVPVFFLLRSGTGLANAGSRGARRSAPLWGLGGGGFLLVFLLAGVSRWEGLWSNFANTRFERASEFQDVPVASRDTVFHVAVIQSIRQNGYPSTGQHENEFLWYHVLTHYVDAGWTALLGLDPWDSYALLFFAKAIVLVLSLLVFISNVAKGNPYAFTVLLVVSAPALMSQWNAVGSHGQWVPFVILFLTASWVASILHRERVDFAALSGITILVFVLSVGKISLGFAFACFVGLWLLFTKPKDVRIYLVGLLWLTFFALWYLQVLRPDRPEVPFVDRLMRTTQADVVSLAGVTLVTLALWYLTKDRRWGVFFLVLNALGILYVFLALFVVKNSGADFFYFVHGLYSVVVLVFLATITGFFLSRGSSTFKRPSVKELGQYAALLAIVFIPLLPTVAKSPVISGFSPMEGFQNIYSANFSTYKWPSVALSDGGSWSVLGGVPVRDPERVEEETFLSRLKTTVDQKLSAEGLETSSTLLFIPEEGWEGLEANYPFPRNWASGLLVKAVTGVTLIYSIPLDRPETYGFADYTNEGFRLEDGGASDSMLCRFDKPVLVIERPAEVLEISVRCR